MAQIKKKKKLRSNDSLDGVYLLKLVLFLIVGAQWVWFVSDTSLAQIPIPVGLVIGFIFAWHEHFRIDRKIEYAVLLVAMMVGFWSQAGIYIHY